jgi:membrane-associated phospholipid phosphatase
MHWQFMVVAGFVVSVALFLAALFLYSNLRGLHSTTQKVLRLRTDRAVNRSTTETDCRG